VNSTTAAQQVFMTCPGSVNVLSMGNTLTFFSARKEFTSCHKMAGAKKSYGVLCTMRTDVPAYLCTYLPTYLHTHTHTHTHTHLRNCTQAQRHTRIYIHGHTNTHAHASDKSHNQYKYIIRNSVLSYRNVLLQE